MPVGSSGLFGTSAVHFAPVADSDHLDDSGIIIDGVNNPVRSLPDAVPIFIPAQFFTSGRLRAAGQSLDLTDDPLAISLPRNSLEFLGGRVFDAEVISCHGAEAR